MKDVSNDKPTGQTLMIVEDEALIAIVLRDVLTEAGYNVVDLTTRHAEPLEVAKACKPDLALVNTRLAANDDGIELAVQLKALSIPVIHQRPDQSGAHSGNRGDRLHAKAL